MKLAGSELMFGQGCLEYIKKMPYKNVFIVVGGSSMEKSGMLKKVTGYFMEAGAKTKVFKGVEPDPSINTVLEGAAEMIAFSPDLIVALGGGSAMDAAKAMWVYYEHPELKTLKAIVPPNPIPKLRNKARLCCIPSTSGTASEVSRSIVITDNETGLKYGIGDMEMMPDVAICDPEVTLSMPPHITAETGMDALTHAMEALVSNRANYVSHVLAYQAAKDIIKTLPKAVADGSDIEARETMLNASMIAGMAFTNVSLGIVHSMAHALGSYFKLAHGFADAVVLPYVIEFNAQNQEACKIYDALAKECKKESLAELVKALNKTLGIPACLKERVEDGVYMKQLNLLAVAALNDGCTKTNPVIPTIEQFKELFIKVYRGA